MNIFFLRRKARYFFRIVFCFALIVLSTLPLSSPAIAGWPFGLFSRHRHAVQRYQYNGDPTLGEIIGRVTGDLMVLGGVKVALLQNEKIIDCVMTDENGDYEFKYVNPGNYDVKGEKNGFRTSITREVPVKENKLCELDFYLPKLNTVNIDKYPIVQSYFWRGK
jgi:hypothetical protein